MPRTVTFFGRYIEPIFRTVYSIVVWILRLFLKTTLPLNDVQGLIFRGYRYPYVRHFFLRVEDKDKARKWIGSLVSDPNNPLQITSGKTWPKGTKPRVILSLGMTQDGVTAIGVPKVDLRDNFQTFAQGATKNSEILGDTGSSAPEQWPGNLGTTPPHLVLSMWTLVESDIEHFSELLRKDFSGGITEQYTHDGQALPNDYVHFGYKDSISQPIVEGLGPGNPDDQPSVKPYYFIVLNSFFAPYLVPKPTKFWLHGSFGAFRILKQDVDLFEEYLETQGRIHGVDKEILAAKVCGRWRDGVPLALAPNSPVDMPYKDLNNFNYIDRGADVSGATCPYPSHMRRTNARSDDAVSGGIDRHRVMRRAMPYGPPYTGTADGVERGLIGYFMGVDLGAQFESIMVSWVNGKCFTVQPDTPVGFDPLLGANDGGNSSIFKCTLPDGRAITMNNVPRFITTRGSVYCFLPSITSLKFIGRLKN